MNKLAIVAIASVLLLPAGRSDAQSIRRLSLDSVTGLHNTDTIYSDQTIIFHIRLTNVSPPDSLVIGLWNGFRVYSPTGAHWLTCTGAFTDAIPNDAFPYRYVASVGTTGENSDTVVFEAACGFAGGYPLPESFDGVGMDISIGPIDGSFEGHVICLDSAMAAEGDLSLGNWRWRLGGSCDWIIAEVLPDWDGPYCFTVIRDPCATFISGDVNRDSATTAADIIALVNYMFKGSGSVCGYYADVNCTGTVTAADVIYLVNYIFKGGPLPCNTCLSPIWYNC